MKTILQRLPLSVFLLPVFFVLHGYLENAGYIHSKDAIVLTGFYLLWAMLLFILSLIFFRNRIKAGLATFILLSIFFFFGALQDFLKHHIHSLSRYSILLPALIVVAISLIIILKRTSVPVIRLNLFINYLLIIYIVIDLAMLLTGQLNNNNKLTTYSGNVPFTPCPSCNKPDIYFLVFDAYESSAGLKEKYHYDNGAFDSFLLKEDFHIQTQSRANYKYTILSIPSILNMEYLDKLNEVKGGPKQEYYYLSDLIKKNHLTDFLRSQGYTIVNCSIFDLEGNPSPITGSLLPLKTRLITDQTLYSRCMRDIGWYLFQFSYDPFSKKVLYNDLNNNNKLIGEFEKAIVPATTPRFVYCHLNLPHPPYYFDSTQNKKAVKSIYTASDEDDIKSYLDYLNYTNETAKNLIMKIQKATNKQAVIIFMGDHGLRYHDSLGYNPPWFLQNQNAVYLPAKDYAQFYDSISGVNQFRVILNTLFKQNIPLLKDSIVNVKDKK